MEEFWRIFLELLRGSFWGILVPLCVWIWRYVIVFFLLLHGAGTLAVPLWFYGTRRVSRLVGSRAGRVLLWCGALVLLWLWGHIWVASLITFTAAVFAKPVTVGTAVSDLVILWVWGVALMAVIKQSSRHPDPGQQLE